MILRTATLAMLLSGALAATPCLASPVVFTGTLSGANEQPPNGSTGTGPVTVSYDPVTDIMTVTMIFSGLQGPTTVAHIHCCVAGPGVNGGVASQLPSFPGFPASVVAGSYDQGFDMTDPASFNPSFITNNGGTTASALAALLEAMGRGGAYFNLHTSEFPGGELRADLFEQPIFADGFE